MATIVVGSGYVKLFSKDEGGFYKPESKGLYVVWSDGKPTTVGRTQGKWIDADSAIEYQSFPQDLWATTGNKANVQTDVFINKYTDAPAIG